MEINTACLRLRDARRGSGLRPSWPEGVAKLGETARLYCRRGL